MRRLNVSGWSIRQPIPSVLLFVVLMALGFMSFRHLPITRFPNIDIPLVSVTITQSGAAPSELETQVTKKVEDSIAGLASVKHITSTITDGVSTTNVEFYLGTNTDRALNDVKDAVARIRSSLPRTIDEPISQRIDVEGLPIVTYAARAPKMTLEQLSWFIDDVVARKLQGVRGVAKVERIGGVDREIRVSLIPERLLALGVTAGDVSRQLRATNVDVSGGRSEIGGAEQAIRALGAASTVERLASTMIALPGGRKVRLDDLGKVSDSIREPRKFARLNGEPVVAFNIQRAKGSSDVVVANGVAKAVSELAKRTPGVKFDPIDSTVSYTAGNYRSAMHTLIEGAVLAIIVVFLFLRDVRATVMASIALPLSVLPAFWAMDVLGFSLNLVSLLALTLVTGILVDDAIVEIENIVRHMRQGKSPYRAAMEAAEEIGLAVIAISLTIAAVFIPVSFMGGIAGQYFRQFGLTVAIAVLFSLLVARLITPMLSAYFLRPVPVHDEHSGWLLTQYARLAAWSVKHRIITVFVGLIIFFLSILSMKLLPQGFVPSGDASRALFAVELPPGSKLADTIALTDRIAPLIRKRPEVKSVFVDGGRILGMMGGGAEVRKATLVVAFVPKTERKLSQAQLERAISRDLAQIPDIRSWMIRDNGQRAVMLEVLGSDAALVTSTAARLGSEMRRLPMLGNVVTGAAIDRPELRIRPRPDLAAELGVPTETISEVIRIATIGDVDANLAKFNAGVRQIPIRVQLDEAARGNRQILESLKVATASGAAAPLIAVAKIEPGQGPTAIERYDRLRRVTIGADLVGDALGAAIDAAKALPAATNAPVGVIVKESGDAEIMGEVFEGFAVAMAAGLMMVYVVLVLLFHSFLQPVTILFSLPMSIGGAIFALLITQRPVSMPVVIGILMLMGVVTKNAIMLVDFAVEEIARGMPRLDAIVDAGRKRARPIIMTTIAMVGGMAPSALGLGEGGEFRSPMAIAVIGGLIVSTVLSLLFVPAVFVLMDDLAGLIWSAVKRFIGPTDEPEEKKTGAPQGAAE
jgi:multidrug efflux pump subunit AcrB